MVWGIISANISGCVGLLFGAIEKDKVDESLLAHCPKYPAMRYATHAGAVALSLHSPSGSKHHYRTYIDPNVGI